MSIVITNCVHKGYSEELDRTIELWSFFCLIALEMIDSGFDHLS